MGAAIVSPSAIFMCALLAFLAQDAEAFYHLQQLRGGARSLQLPQLELPVSPCKTVATAPASSPFLADVFARMDTNKDGQVDQNEFIVAQQPLNGFAAAPGPATAAFAPGPAAPGPAPAPAPAEEQLPSHNMIPPPLPENIPEPPPPPRAPPAEPEPPPRPPREGQMVGPPPGNIAMEAAGKVTDMMAGVPGLDLEGTHPLQPPNTPPPLAVPPALTPPELPRVVKPLAPPPSRLLSAMMTPLPVAFGIDMSNSLRHGIDVTNLNTMTSIDMALAQA